MSKALISSLNDIVGCKCNVDDFIFVLDHGKNKDNTTDKCICGVNIVYKYSIKYIKTNEIIYPIGSECIKNFLFDDFELVQEYKNLKKKQVKGGKLKGLLYIEMSYGSLKWFYEKCKSNKPYVQEIKRYYYLKYIKKIPNLIKMSP